MTRASRGHRECKANPENRGLKGSRARRVNRDYPVMFGTLYFFTLLGLIMNLIGDLMYHVVDPRIDFEARTV